jgi:hypothetical protein
VIFDEQEHPAFTTAFPVLPPPVLPSACPPQCGIIPAPAASNRVKVGSASLPVPYSFGWMFLDFKSPVVATDPHAQSYVAAIVSTPGRYAVETTATALDSSCTPKSCVPGSGVGCPTGN